MSEDKIDHSDEINDLVKDLTNCTDKQLANAAERVASEKGKWKDEDARADFEQKIKDEQARRQPATKDKGES